MPYIGYASAVTALELRILAFLGVWNVRMGMSDDTVDRRDSRAREQQQDARAPGNVWGPCPTFAAELHDRERSKLLFIVQRMCKPHRAKSLDELRFLWRNLAPFNQRSANFFCAIIIIAPNAIFERDPCTTPTPSLSLALLMKSHWRMSFDKYANCCM